MSVVSHAFSGEFLFHLGTLRCFLRQAGATSAARELETGGFVGCVTKLRRHSTALLARPSLLYWSRVYFAALPM